MLTVPFGNIPEYRSGVRAHRTFPSLAGGEMLHGFLELGAQCHGVVAISCWYGHRAAGLISGIAARAAVDL